MKAIHEFEVKREIEKEVSEETENGTLVKKIKEEEPVKIIFKQPTRAESEEADLMYAVEFGKCVRNGVLTRALIEKLYDEKDKSGVLADDFGARYLELYQRYFRIQNKYTELDLKENKTDKDKIELEELAGEFALVRQDLQTLEASRNQIYQNTAETKAQNKTILWLTLNLGYITHENKQIPFCKGNTFEEKLASYDKMVEKNDPFEMKVMDKLAFYVAIWYLGRASTQEDFIKIDQDLNPPMKESEEKEPEKPEEKEVKPEEQPESKTEEIKVAA